MMEVTPHLKNVLKNYQHSATKSLQGPGLALVQSATTKNELPSPELKEDEFVAAPPFPVQQVPILTTPDTSCSERSETVLEGECISCFVVGGEKRLCLPQVLNSVLRVFSLNQINQECDRLQIYCSRCTPEQLTVLKSHRILPSSAPSCGLITKTDAERLCSALLYGQNLAPIRNAVRKGAISFSIYHECFGKSRGICYPEMYLAKNAACIECMDCQCGFSPQQFVCHVHNHLENRTVHWGFDSTKWRCYLRVPKDQVDFEQGEKCLDEMREQYEGKLPFPAPPPPPAIETVVKRKQILASEILKERELPLKKQKLDELLNLNMSYMNMNIQQICANIEQNYLQQYLPEFTNCNRYLSAFKPVAQSIKESKIRQANALGIITRYADPPLLQNPEKVVLQSETERFERSYQPNVALALPTTPKKHHHYGKHHQFKQQDSVSSTTVPEIKNEPVSPTIKQENVEVKVELDDESEEKVDSSVSVVKFADFELSTDTEDSASETSDKSAVELSKIEEVLREVGDSCIRDRALELLRQLSMQHERALREKDVKILLLEQQNNKLLNELNENNNDEVENDSECAAKVDVSSSIIKATNEQVDKKQQQLQQQTSVIASLEDAEQKAIIQTAPGE